LTVKVVLTDHALERYEARVKPGISKEAAREEITALMQGQEIEPTPGFRHKTDFEAFMTLSDGIALGLRPPRRMSKDIMLAVSVLVRGARSEGENNYRKTRKAKAKERREARRRRWNPSRKRHQKETYGEGWPE
jgi:hypothetical protein